jgi:hypothetical protein
LYRDLLEETRRLPGVTHAGLISALPLQGEFWDRSVDMVEATRREIQQPVANMRFMSPGYYEGIGLALVSGRRLQESDFGRPLAWISESLTREFPERNPVGMHMRWYQPGTGKKLSLEVAGIVRDVRAEAEKKAPSTVYMPYWIWPPWNPAIVVRAAADPAGIAAAVRRLIRRTHGEVPVTRVEALRDALQEAVASLPDHAGGGVCGVGGAPGNTGNLWSGSVGHHAAKARDRHPPSDGRVAFQDHAYGIGEDRRAVSGQRRRGPRRRLRPD